MRLSDFDFDLPERQIAQYPPDVRSGGRLLVLDGGDSEPGHRQVVDLPEYFRKGDLLVLNNTRVYPARLNGNKQSGGRVELLVERIIGDTSAMCLCRASKSPKAGTSLVLSSGHTVQVTGRQGDLFEVNFAIDDHLIDYLKEHGALPLPPYIQRDVKSDDLHRYQTIYATETGAVAAPTAGLHFDDALLNSCQAVGADIAFTTLHVGAGTFQPVRSDNIGEHKMHAERMVVSEPLCRQISDVKASGGRVLAVGTTVVRALESAAVSGTLQPFDGETRLFLKPGDRFNVIDGLVTNFHLPRSTLLMLVCAFAGTERMLQAYAQAVQHGYQFFSYGDAMIVFPESVSR